MVKTSLIFTPLYSFNFSIFPPLMCLPFLLKQVTLCPSFTILVDNSSTTTSIPPSRDGMCLCPIIAILTVFSPFFPFLFLCPSLVILLFFYSGSSPFSSPTPFTQCPLPFLPHSPSVPSTFFYPSLKNYLPNPIFRCWY